MVTSYAAQSSAILLAVVAIIENGIWDSLILMVAQVLAATIRQQRTKSTDLEFIASDEETSRSSPTMQMLLLSLPVRIKHGSDQKQQDSRVDNFEKNPVPPTIAGGALPGSG